MNNMIRIAAVACLSALLLSACGAKPGTQTVESASQSETSQVQQREQVFQYAKKSLPDGWKVLDQYGTSTYLEAVYGEGENAPTLSVSVLQYDDSHGYGKAQALAEAVRVREKKSSDIGTRKIGGTNFYYLSFPSPNDSALLRYEFYGQTEPDSDNNYMFYIITLDQLTDAKQFEKLQDVLDCVDFSEQ